MSEWRNALEGALTQHGLSLDGLHQQVGDDPLLGRWLGEEPLRTPSPAIYLALSDYTEIEVEVLTGEVDPADTLAVAMRSRGQTAPTEVLQRSSRLLRAARAVLRLEPYSARLRELQALQSRFSAGVSSPWAARQQGKKAALQVRAHLDLGLEPVLDLVGLIEDLGVPVEFAATLPEGLHGVTSWTQTRDGWVATITVNANDYWTVQRFSLAHEFCHVLHQDRPQGLTTEYEEDPRIASDPSETRAEAFASHLLAPRTGLGLQWQQAGLAQQSEASAVANVMWYWGLSREASCYALEDAPLVHWTKQHTERVKSLRIGEMLGEAGLVEEWETMTDTESPAPSAWLAEATAELFLSSRLPVENYAVVTNQDPNAAVHPLLPTD